VEGLELIMAQCRLCDQELKETFCDLGMSPMANSYLASEQLDRAEVFYPLHAYVCSGCLLVQLAEFESPEEIFGDYLYFSSYSAHWLEHARKYVEDAIQRFDMTASDQVIEIASNDGYLLKNFVAAGIPALGVEPAANVAAVAVQQGIPTTVGFFGTELAAELVEQGIRADLLIGNNVFAHVPNLNDFVAGMAMVLSPEGRVTLEFPHLYQLIECNQFDTIYHEHFSYFSLLTATTVLEKHGLRVFDVEELPTHGGSLRVYACLAGATRYPMSERVADVRRKESAAGLDTFDGHLDYSRQVERVKHDLLQFLIDAKRKGARVAAYGAPAKGNTLLNYCGIRSDLIAYTVDRSPHKQGRFLPGTHLPIYDPDYLREARPDYVVILPWNLRDEIIADLSYVQDWDGKFVVPIPALAVLDA
jgi:hypothetical protein